MLLRLHWLASTDIAPRLCCMQGVYDGSVQALSLALVGSSELVGRVFGECRARVGLGGGQRSVDRVLASRVRALGLWCVHRAPCCSIQPVANMSLVHHGMSLTG